MLNKDTMSIYGQKIDPMMKNEHNLSLKAKESI